MSIINCARETTTTTTTTTTTSEGDYTKFESRVQLGTYQHDDKENGVSRTINYGTAGNPNGTPIVFFPPLEGTRRMLVSMHETLLQNNLKALCVDRPGVEGTSWAPSSGTNSAVQDHLNQTCKDIITILDTVLGWKNKVGIFCMCAGTPFALAFCSKYGDRTNGKILCLAPWILPADCPHSKALNRFAAKYLPQWPISYFVGSLSSFFMNHVFSKETIAKKLYSSSSEQEQQAWDMKFKDWPAAEALTWILGSAAGNTIDISVCLSSSKDLGFEYSSIVVKNGNSSNENNSSIEICVGENDHMTSVESSNWFAERLGNANVTIVPKGTHNGALFLLGEQYEGSLQFLKES